MQEKAGQIWDRIERDSSLSINYHSVSHYTKLPQMFRLMHEVPNHIIIA